MHRMQTTNMAEEVRTLNLTLSGSKTLDTTYFEFILHGNKVENPFQLSICT